MILSASKAALAKQAAEKEAAAEAMETQREQERRDAAAAVALRTQQREARKARAVISERKRWMRELAVLRKGLVSFGVDPVAADSNGAVPNIASPRRLATMPSQRASVGRA